MLVYLLWAEMVWAEKVMGRNGYGLKLPAASQRIISGRLLLLVNPAYARRTS